MRPKNNWGGLRDAIFWLSVPITLVLCWTCVELGPSVEGAQQLGRAFVAGTIGVICFLTTKEDPDADS